jgi:hypothetical protein
MACYHDLCLQWVVSFGTPLPQNSRDDLAKLRSHYKWGNSPIHMSITVISTSFDVLGYVMMKKTKWSIIGQRRPWEFVSATSPDWLSPQIYHLTLISQHSVYWSVLGVGWVKDRLWCPDSFIMHTDTSSSNLFIFHPRTQCSLIMGPLRCQSLDGAVLGYKLTHWTKVITLRGGQTWPWSMSWIIHKEHGIIKIDKTKVLGVSLSTSG